ncbi:MAG TPA: DeoR/GlpR family DNA-binding transcription regulator [Jiangellales bacterium]|nr:DeoR/GlpR family DNA-binding transcription regulator [Jiangellales bacterium]
MTVLAAQRQARILEEVQRKGAVRVSDLTALLGVSDMTVRRDLDVLARQSRVDKVHGGATIPRSPSTDEPGFEVKWLRNRREKAAIAVAAATLVMPGSAVGLSAGTTTWTLAHRLREVPGITVVTNSVQVAGVLHAGGMAGQTVILTGGVRTPSDALVGPLAASGLRQLHLDMVFLGVHGMDERGGYTTPNMLEAETDRAFIEAARRLVVVADSSKWGELGISTIAALEEADVLVTDTGLPDHAAAVLRDKVDEVRLVESAEGVG